MHNLVWVMLSIAVGLFLSFISGGLFSANYSSFWPALGSIGTLGAWFFLYQQSQATNEQMRISNEQLKIIQMETFRAEIERSIERVVSYIKDDGEMVFTRLAWINAAVEIENIEKLIKLLPQEFQQLDLQRLGRLLDSQLPNSLFDSGKPKDSLLDREMYRVHGIRGSQVQCENNFPRQYDLYAVYLFSQQYIFIDDFDAQYNHIPITSFLSEDPYKNRSYCPVCENRL